MINMGDYFAGWLDKILGSVEELFNAFWDASEYAIEVALVESGKSLESFVGWYKNKIISEYRLAYEKIKDDRAKTAQKIYDKLTDKKEIEKALKQADELRAKREKKLEQKKAAQLQKLENARKSRLAKLKKMG